MDEETYNYIKELLKSRNIDTEDEDEEEERKQRIREIVTSLGARG
jgi:hypothetical protein